MFLGVERERWGIADSPDTIPAFATTLPAAILASMPLLENNVTQPWIIAPELGYAFGHGPGLAAVET